MVVLIKNDIVPRPQIIYSKVAKKIINKQTEIFH